MVPGAVEAVIEKEDISGVGFRRGLRLPQGKGWSVGRLVGGVLATMGGWSVWNRVGVRES